MHIISTLIEFYLNLYTQINPIGFIILTCAGSSVVFQRISNWTGTIIGAWSVHTVVGERTFVRCGIQTFIYICETKIQNNVSFFLFKLSLFNTFASVFKEKESQLLLD